MRAVRFYPRLSKFAMERVMKSRSSDVRSLVLFNRVAVIWDAPDNGRKVDFK